MRAACHALDIFPDLARLHAAHPDRYPHLLESAVQGTPRARFDILFAFPGITRALTQGDAHAFLEQLEDDWRCEALPAASLHETGLPFTGGWFVFFGYELVSGIEPSVHRYSHDDALPIAFATRFPAAVLRDHATHQTWLVAESGHESLLETMRNDLAQCPAPDDRPVRVERIEEEPPQQFLDGVRRVLAYIGAGDVFQVNLSRRWEITLRDPPSAVSLYRRLREANPAPFAGLASLPGGGAIVSSSPERLVTVQGGRISTRPIAGTYPRSDNAERDGALARELLANPKERAEHVMLIDLERNDLGRVCRAGSVAVPEFMTVESYPHVHHIVSEVSGELREGVTPVQVIRAVFPGGTITGCPKIRCMQIIHELERAPRGAYTGSMGYINRDGSMDMNILIRTLMVNGRSVGLRAGAGIVADSIPDRELAETRAKARGMLTALGIIA